MGDSILFGFCPRLIPAQVQPESESETECDSVRVGKKPVALLWESERDREVSLT